MNNKSAIYGVVLVIAISVCSLSSGAELFPALRDKRLGYSDRKGQILIPCRFERTFPDDWGNLVPSTVPQEFEFHEGIAIVPDGERCGVIDISGHWVFRERYRHIGRFQNGIAIGHDDSGAGFLRRDGSWLVKPRFRSCLPFSEGLAAVSMDRATNIESVDGTTLWGFVDTLGRTRIPLKFADVKSFREGLAAACELAGGKWGFIDREGEWSVKPQFDGVVAPFHDGLAVAQNDDRQFFVDRSGTEVFSANFRRTKQFSEGFAACTVPTPLGLRVGFIDRSGKFAIPALYLASGSFSEGLCAVRVPPGWAYIDHSGAIVIRTRRIFSAGSFDGGVATLMISPERRAFLFRDRTLLVEDGDDRNTETDMLNNDAVGLTEDKLLVELAEEQWSVNVQEFLLYQLRVEVVDRLPPLPKDTILRRVVGERKGITGTWWLTKDPKSSEHRVFHNRFLPNDLME